MTIGERPGSRNFAIRLVVALAMFAATLFVACNLAAAQEKVLHDFNNNGTDGVYPMGGLVSDAAGNLYGTTSKGGTYDLGTVFELTPAAGGGWTEQVLHNFSTHPDGAGPGAGLIFDTSGNLYGTTERGGTYDRGTVFELTPAAGSWTEQVLYNFGFFTDAAYPGGGMIFDGAGNLYGTTVDGGVHFCGTVFELTPTTGGSWTESVLYSFKNAADGCMPSSRLVTDAVGNLYGTTGNEGTYNGGTAFELSPTAGGAWTETVLHSFGQGTDGIRPNDSLIFDTAGNLYGTTSDGGPYGGGMLFELIPADGGGWTETVLYNFGKGMPGSHPSSGLIADIAGNLYGTTSDGGPYSSGTVFRFKDGGVVVLYGFHNTDGSSPVGGLIMDAAGNLYGTTYYGGAYSSGIAFEVHPPAALQFVPLSQPCRAVDTRPENGGNGPIQRLTSQDFAISGEGSCPVLASAAVYSTNITVVPSYAGLGYLTVWPAGQQRPIVSTLNSLDGRIKANAAIVSAGANGQISIFASEMTNVIVDVNGYFTPPTGSTLAFYPLTPCRVADTRKSNFPPGLGAPSLPANQERQFPILNATTTCNIPTSGVAAYSLNFTVVPSGSLGFLTVWPTGQARPTVSTLNDGLGRVIANAAIVVAGTSGNVSAYPTSGTDLIIDINGYFAPAGTGGLSLYGVTPCRVLDTRQGGGGPPFTGVLSPAVDVVNSGCGVSSNSQAYVFNATVIPAVSLGYLTLWPDGTTQPVVSTLNAADGSWTNNMAIVPAGTAGKVDAYATGLTQLLLDISSYFAP